MLAVSTLGNGAEARTVKLLQAYLQSAFVQVIPGCPWAFSMYSRRPLWV